MKGWKGERVKGWKNKRIEEERFEEERIKELKRKEFFNLKIWRFEDHLIISKHSLLLSIHGTSSQFSNSQISKFSNYSIGHSICIKSRKKNLTSSVNGNRQKVVLVAWYLGNINLSTWVRFYKASVTCNCCLSYFLRLLGPGGKTGSFCFLFAFSHK